MLRDRYDPYSLFDAVPQLHLRFEPGLAALDRLLEDDELFRVAPPADRLMAPTERRVVRGEAVPAADTVLSLFEPHTRPIGRARRGS